MLFHSLLLPRCPSRTETDTEGYFCNMVRSHLMAVHNRCLFQPVDSLATSSLPKITHCFRLCTQVPEPREKKRGGSAGRQAGIPSPSAPDSPKAIARSPAILASRLQSGQPHPVGDTYMTSILKGGRQQCCCVSGTMTQRETKKSLRKNCRRHINMLLSSSEMRTTTRWQSRPPRIL